MYGGELAWMFLWVLIALAIPFLALAQYNGWYMLLEFAVPFGLGIPNLIDWLRP